MARWHEYNYTGAPYTCRWCGRPLAKVTRAVHVAEGQPEPIRYNDHPILEITSRKPASGGGTVLGVWYGKYGYRGNGYFCGLRCGYQFATNKAWRT